MILSKRMELGDLFIKEILYEQFLRLQKMQYDDHSGETSGRASQNFRTGDEISRMPRKI